MRTAISESQLLISILFETTRPSEGRMLSPKVGLGQLMLPDCIVDTVPGRVPSHFILKIVFPELSDASIEELVPSINNPPVAKFLLNPACVILQSPINPSSASILPFTSSLPLPPSKSGSNSIYESGVPSVHPL